MFMNRKPIAVNILDEERKEIFVYDVIGYWGVTKRQVADALAKVRNQDITVRIASEGGDIFEAHAMYNLLKEHAGKVTTVVDSLAASAASYLAMVGQERRMAENAMFMIHDPWGFTMGDSEEHRKTADLLDKLKTTIVDIYRARSGSEDQQVRDWMTSETWFSAAEAKEAGFVDEILPNKGAKAGNQSAPFQNLARFRNVPKDFLAANEKAGTPHLDSMRSRLQAG